MLEAGQHVHSLFATLTFVDPAPLEVSPLEMAGFMRRLRVLYPGPLRYFGVGEYGDENYRPHYHLAIFGMSYLQPEYIFEAWKEKKISKGFISVAEFNAERAQYLAGYISKKMTKHDDPRLGERHPEFARMSRNPGIGAPAVKTLASTLMTNGPSKAIANLGDVPHEIRSNQKKYPAGRYVREQLRQAIGWDKREPMAVKQMRVAQYQAEEVETREIRERRRDNSYYSAVTKLKNQRLRRKL